MLGFIAARGVRRGHYATEEENVLEAVGTTWLIGVITPRKDASHVAHRAVQHAYAPEEDDKGMEAEDGSGEVCHCTNVPHLPGLRLPVSSPSFLPTSSSMTTTGYTYVCILSKMLFFHLHFRSPI